MPATTAFQTNLAAARAAMPLIAEALRAERLECIASSEESTAWDALNTDKWAAYNEAAEAMGRKAEAVLLDSEEAFLNLLEQFSGQAQMLAKWMA